MLIRKIKEVTIESGCKPNNSDTIETTTYYFLGIPFKKDITKYKIKKG